MPFAEMFNRGFLDLVTRSFFHTFNNGQKFRGEVSTRCAQCNILQIEENQFRMNHRLKGYSISCLSF